MSKNRKTGRPDDPEIKWVECSTCGHWDLFENFNTGIKYNPAKLDKLHIVCRLCKIDIAVKKCNEDIAALRDIFHELERSNSKDGDKVADLVKELDNWKLTVPRHTSPVATPVQMKLTADEVFEINKRKKNVIISGLPESGNDIDDFLYFANTYHSLPAPLSANHIHSAVRLGRAVNPQKPRLLCLILQSVDLRRAILDMWKISNPSSTSRPNHYARPDLTKAQLQADKLLRQQLLVAGKDKFMIQRGKIVERTTTANPRTDLPTSVPIHSAPYNPAPPDGTAIDCVNHPSNPSSISTATVSHPILAINLPTGSGCNISPIPPIGTVSGNTLLAPPLATNTTTSCMDPILTMTTSSTTTPATTTISTSSQIPTLNSTKSSTTVRSAAPVKSSTAPPRASALPTMAPLLDTQAGVPISIPDHNIQLTPDLTHSNQMIIDSSAKAPNSNDTLMLTAAAQSSTMSSFASANFITAPASAIQAGSTASIVPSLASALPTSSNHTEVDSYWPYFSSTQDAFLCNRYTANCI